MSSADPDRRRIGRALWVAAVLLAVAAGLVAALTVGSRPLASGASPFDGPTPPAPVTDEPPDRADPGDDDALAGTHVLLDPGHNAGNAQAPGEINALVDDGRGGTKACNTVGTSTGSGYEEHAFAWDVADRTQALLADAGAEVTLTRGPDGVGPCVPERGRMAAEVDADVLVSIHANGSEDPAVQGFFVMVAEPPLNEAQGGPSRALADALVQALAGAGFAPSNVYEDPVVGRADLATLNHADRPVVMLELAEMRNPEEAAAVESEEGRQRYAEALAAGLAAWAGER